MESERTSSGRFNRMCVFCGSSSGRKSVYSEVAVELGKELARRSIDLVYGGGSIGLMGTVAKTVQDAGGHVVGIIPKALMPREITGKTVGDVVAVDNMHQRKAEMASRADAFIALPGGYGTFEELLEIVTWSQLGIHSKPVGVLNVDGYYDSLLALFDKSLDEGFLNLASRLIVVAAPTPHELLDQMEVYAPVHDDNVPKLSWEVTTATSLLPPTTSTPRRETQDVRTTHVSATLPQQKASKSAAKPLSSINADYSRHLSDILSSSLSCITTFPRLSHPVARFSFVNRSRPWGLRERKFNPISPLPRAFALSTIF